MEKTIGKNDLSVYQIRLHKEQIRDKHQALLLGEDVDSHKILSAYKKEIIDFVTERTDGESEERFTIPPINLKNTTALSIDSDYIGLDLVTMQEMAEKTVHAQEREFNITNDIAILKRVAQNFINKNNQKSEVALSNSKMQLDEIMVSYATKEQEIVDLYKWLVLKYQEYVQTPLDHSVYALSLYFDNYFVDFEENLKHIEKGDNATEHPYYMKMFRTTQDKLSVIYRIYLDNIKALKLQYIEDERAYTELHHESQKYVLEYEMLLSEFNKYATLFLNALDADENEFACLSSDQKELAERFKQI